MTATRTEGFALIIGVNDYSVFDASCGKPAGTSDLGGSVNDAVAWWRLCQDLGFAPENVRVLTSPPVDLTRLPGATAANVGPATEAEILKQAAWLVTSLRGGKKPIGLATFSGHGDWIDAEGLAICPSDVAGASLDHAISFKKLRAFVDSSGAAPNLTVILDCCHAGAGGARSGLGPNAARQLSLRGLPVPAHMVQVELAEEVCERVFAACGRDQTAFQATFDGQVHGAFTWALTVAREQWTIVDTGDSAYLTMAHGQLLDRSRALLAALSFDQAPELHGPPGIHRVPVFKGSLEGGLGRTSLTPDAPRAPMQLDPGAKDYCRYALKLSDGSILGSIIVTGATAGAGFAANMEYWYLAANIGTQTSITFTSSDSFWTSPPTESPSASSFRMPRNATWTSGTAPSSGALTFVDATNKVILVWGLALGRGTWSGSLTWYNDTGKSNVFAGTSAATATANTTPPTGVSWSTTTLSL